MCRNQHLTILIAVTSAPNMIKLSTVELDHEMQLHVMVSAVPKQQYKIG